MIKVTGALVIIFSCTYIGINISNKYRQRVKELLEIKRIVGIMLGEIRYSLTPIPNIFQIMIDKTDGVFKKYFIVMDAEVSDYSGLALKDIWNNNLKILKDNTCLNSNDIELFSMLGNNLGFLDKQMQIDTINLYIEQLSDQIIESKAALKDKTRLFSSLGVLGGILIVIVLI